MSIEGFVVVGKGERDAGSRCLQEQLKEHMSIESPARKHS